MRIYRFLPLFMLSLLSLVLSAQVTQGVITYEVITDAHSFIPEDRPELKEMITQFRTENYQLFFTPSESLYKTREELLPPGTGGGRGGGMRMMIRGPRSETYIDRNSQQRIVARDLLGKNYLIIDTLGIEPWKFGYEQMEIAGYMCMMAWYTDTVNNQEVTAWFSPELPPLMGPDRFTTLPGTVLAVDINNGNQVWVAREIEAREPSDSELRKPSRGEEIGRKEFDKLLEEQKQRLNSSGSPIRVF
ncbi:MAG: GLPGLI family protein [Bacteroides sp.]|jgi:GLPGLI family protein|nr:GLPGLI family protein [Bacteroides sp.]